MHEGFLSFLLFMCCSPETTITAINVAAETTMLKKKNL
jgi:hypothetical protein